MRTQNDGSSNMEVDGGVGHQGGDRGGVAPTQFKRRVYVPGKSRPLKEDEVLDYDPSAYRFFHKFETTLPSLSFDVVEDSLGQGREQFPLTFYIVSGTQAERAKDNEISLIRMCNIKPEKEKSEPDSSDDEDSEDEEDPADLPHFQSAIIPNHGNINRIKCQRLGSGTGEPIVAAWNDRHGVQLWSLARSLATVDQLAEERGPVPRSSKDRGAIKSMKEERPLFTFGGHNSEGWALAWAPLTPGDLVSGDRRSNLFLWHLVEGGRWVIDQQPYAGHQGSVEDVQWSPTEAALLVSASTDHSLRLWDVRAPRREACVCTVANAHKSDVNVLDWNRYEALIVSGGDDAALNVWSLKTIQYGQPVARFAHHTAPITSVAWAPHETTLFMASGEDDQVTFWDLALEPDDLASGTGAAGEEAGDDGAATEALPEDLPPQLMFVHMGQKEIKEVHWHRQVPGLALTTALDGFNFFRTINI